MKKVTKKFAVDAVTASTLSSLSIEAYEIISRSKKEVKKWIENGRCGDNPNAKKLSDSDKILELKGKELIINGVQYIIYQIERQCGKYVAYDGDYLRIWLNNPEGGRLRINWHSTKQKATEVVWK